MQLDAKCRFNFLPEPEPEPEPEPAQHLIRCQALSNFMDICRINIRSIKFAISVSPITSLFC
jgi:hypothetical protein